MALPFLLLQAVYAISMLEVVNYVEHYGLLRQKDTAGRYVRCEPEHSWNSNHLVGNLLLYQLQRHSDHHAHPLRRYQSLRHFDGLPTLPSGYFGMFVVAYIPPLWFWMMDKRLLDRVGRDTTNINLDPARRAALVRRYGLVDAQGASA
jgi:alkane 1-monooxygenase